MSTEAPHEHHAKVNPVLLCVQRVEWYSWWWQRPQKTTAAAVEAAEQRLRAYCAIYFVEVSESEEEYPDPEPDLLEPPVSKSNRSNWFTFSLRNPNTSVTSSHSHAKSSLEFVCFKAGVACGGCFVFKLAFWLPLPLLLVLLLLLAGAVPWSLIAARSLFRLKESDLLGGCGLRTSPSLALLFISLLSRFRLLNSASLASFRNCLLSASFFCSVL